MQKLRIDIETRSRVDITSSNVYRYTEDPDFKFLMAAWAIDDQPTQIETTHKGIVNIPGLWDNRVLKVAHNAQFERICFSRLKPYDTGTYLSPAYWDDTMARAGVHGYPQGLDGLAKALGAEQKSETGKELIKFFCIPRKDGKFNEPKDHPEKFQQFMDYCVQDVDTLRDVDQRLPEWPTEMERAIYISDQRVNDAGIPVDTLMAQIAVDLAGDNQMVQELEIMDITRVANPNSLPQMKKWLDAQGYPMENMQAATVADALDDPEAPADVKAVLELRQELALVASKKYTAALKLVSEDKRLRGSFRYFGAHTGRWTGSGVQLQNLPSATLQCDCKRCEDDPKHNDVGLHTDRVIAEAVLDLKTGAGASAHTLKALVRALFVGPFTVVDYAAIEARVIAWLAGEEWALQAFRDKRDIYVETAERMGGLTRKEGKVAVLALGFAGGTGSLEAMGAEGDKRKLQFLVDQWRQANPRIVRMWAQMQEAFGEGGPVGKHMNVEVDGDTRVIRLPSGRGITYHEVRWERYRVVDPKTKKVIFKEGFRYADPRNAKLRIGTYGGKLSENVTQAIGRDVLAEAIVRLHQHGKEVVGHVHDEILVLGEDSVDDINRIMTQSPTWAGGMPLDGAGFVCPRYRKD